ncbi:MAG: NAD(+)/NADH kinase [Deltaproteobacteria bacterium]|nr:NAD(+)/NADH kinase [Deltaproteobacteria bacterium]
MYRMIKKIGIVANIEKEKSVEYTFRLREWSTQKGVEVLLDEEIARKMGESAGLERKKLASHVDLLVVLGGDGTLLRTVRFVSEYDIPIVGVNLGEFGFLTEVNLNEMYSALELILKGEYKTEKRIMLDISLHLQAETIRQESILNDVVITRGNLSRILDLETTLDGGYLTTFRADGIIISTPTGSTAYSLSAGGPIIFPEEDSFIINPICPHTLTNRPIIIPDGVEIKVILWTKEQGATVTLDGQLSYTMKSGDSMIIKKSRYVTNLVSSPHRDYMEILRTKLGWGGSPSGTGRS